MPDLRGHPFQPKSSPMYDSVPGCGGVFLVGCGIDYTRTDMLRPRPRILPPLTFCHRTYRRKAVAEEERFDFLRPILNPPQDSSDSLGAAAAGAKGKRKSDPTSGRAGTAGAGARKGKKRMDAELADAAGMGAASASDIQPSGSAMASAAGAGSGGLLALAGLDEEGRRRALLGVMESKPPAASGLGDDEDEDYDNY